MYSIGDILELLKTTSETLNQILETVGWTDQEEFTDEEAELLTAVHQGHLDHEWPYMESYLRKLAETRGLNPEQFDELAKAIAEAGGTLSDYRDRFPDICEKVKGGLTPSQAVMPNTAVAEPVEPFIPVAKKLPEMPPIDFSVFPEGLREVIEKSAEVAANESLKEFQGFGKVAAEVQESAKQYFIWKYVQSLAAKVQDPQFEANLLIQIRSGMEESEKKPLGTLMGGPQMPALTSSSNNSTPG